METMTPAEFFFWFYSGQTKDWLVKDCVDWALLSLEMNEQSRQAWIEAANDMGVELVNV